MIIDWCTQDYSVLQGSLYGMLKVLSWSLTGVAFNVEKALECSLTGVTQDYSVLAWSLIL